MEHAVKPAETKRMIEGGLSGRRGAVDRLEAHDGEHDHAVAAGASLALDVIEVLDRDFIFLSAGRADDGQLPHARIVAPRADGHSQEVLAPAI